MIPFIDLKAQYSALKPDIDLRIQAVLDHGQYIMGPEVAELEARSISRHTQILFATQSTAFLDHFGPEEVIVVERHEGASNLARLDLQTLRSWLEDYTLSEIFNKGVIGGRP